MTTDTLRHHDAVAERPPIYRVIIAASIGNALEWFDFLIGPATRWRRAFI